MPQQLLDVLKEAILIERRGRALYQQAAKQSENSAVREFFQMMADEEDHHRRVLEGHFKAYSDRRQLAEMDSQTTAQKSSADQVLTDTLKSSIAAAGFEAAAIAAAMTLEERSIALYSARAEAADDPREKALFRWLGEWEHDHLTVLVSLEREIREQVWNDQRFWPF